MVTIQIEVLGTGLENAMVRTSGGVNQLASRPSITVPAGSQVYFEATATGSTKFVKWVSADGVEATANPITLPVTIDGSVTAVFQDTGLVSGPIIKELVTNLTDNEDLVKASQFFTGSVCEKYTYLGKYREGNSTVFKFQFEKTCTAAEMGAGGGLANFIAANWKSIASLLALLGVGAIVWMWRDAVTKQVEVQGKISDNTTSNITKVLNDSTLTPDQKSRLIEEILKSNYVAPKGLDDIIQNLAYVIIIVVVGLILIEFLKQRK